MLDTTPTLTVALSQVTSDALDLADHINAVTAPPMGAIATFVGQVRDHDPEAQGTVTKLSYSHHPDAQSFLDDCLRKVLADHDCTDRVTIAVSHRVGDLNVGDAALIVAVASPHRALAFELCPLIVNAVKASVPIWKQQHTADGHTGWCGIDCH